MPPDDTIMVLKLRPMAGWSSPGIVRLHQLLKVAMRRFGFDLVAQFEEKESRGPLTDPVQAAELLVNGTVGNAGTKFDLVFDPDRGRKARLLVNLGNGDPEVALAQAKALRSGLIQAIAGVLLLHQAQPATAWNADGI